MGKSDASSSPADTYIRPITDLKDPASFGPPPKHYAVEGREPTPASSQPEDTSNRASVQTGVPLPSPRRTTLPPPVPPRLPAREGSFPKPRVVTDEDIRKTGGLNTTALDRLEKAGISVHGFGVSSSESSGRPAPPPPVNPVASKFGQLSPSSSEQPTQGTTFIEKRAAVETANNLYKDPSRVSSSDVRSTAKTARNFQQRHGEQIATGIRTAQSMNDKLASPSGKLISPPLPPRSPTSNTPPISSSINIGKKKPPPPPKKKPSLSVTSSLPMQQRPYSKS